MVAPLPGLPTLRVPRSEQRPPKLADLRDMPVIHGLGPEVLGFRHAVQRIGAGPGNPPPGFVGATTSLTEWIFYWAMAKVFHDPVDPRKPPFFGGRDWGYQLATGAFTRQIGSAVIDFVFYANRVRVAIRIQTARFHDAVGALKQGYDRIQLVTLQSQGWRVQDVYEMDFIHDPSGQAAVIVAKEAIGLIQRPSTITTGRSEARA